MPGPLTKVDVIMAAIQLDINRKLRWGKGIVLELVVPDPNETDGYAVVVTMRKGFDRIQQEEVLSGDGRQIIYRIADKAGTLETTLRLKGLCVRADGILSQVVSVPILAPNQPTVYDLTCKTRTLRTDFEKR